MFGERGKDAKGSGYDLSTFFTFTHRIFCGFEGLGRSMRLMGAADEIYILNFDLFGGQECPPSTRGEDNPTMSIRIRITITQTNGCPNIELR
jgi:hypothetical protein